MTKADDFCCGRINRNSENPCNIGAISQQTSRATIARWPIVVNMIGFADFHYFRNTKTNFMR